MEKYFEINEKGNNIKCKIYCNDLHNINSVIISCHGFGGSKDNSSTQKIADTFLKKEKDMAVISFDWPCHGTDVKKNLTLEDCNDYLDSVINFVRTSLNVDTIFSQATSFGGYLTLKYISENGNPFEKVALRCPAVNMHYVLTENILTPEEKEQVARGKSVLTGFDRKIKITPELIEELRTNDIQTRDYTDLCGTIRIMQGTTDELVAHNVTETFADNNLIDFDTIEGADHRFKDPAKMRECIDIMEELYGPVLVEKKRQVNNL